MGVEGVVADDGQDPFGQEPEIRVDGGGDRPTVKAELLGQRMCRKRQPRGHAEAGTASLERKEQVGVGACVHDAHLAIRRDDLCLEQCGSGHPAIAREAAEAARLCMPADPHARAPAALDIAVRLGDNGIVELNELGPRPHAHGRHGGVRALAPLRHEGIVHFDAIHAAGPDHEAVGRGGLAEIAVRAPLDDQPEAMVAGKIDGGCHVLRPLRLDRIDARRTLPAAVPAERLGGARFVLNVKGVGEDAHRILAGLRVT